MGLTDEIITKIEKSGLTQKEIAQKAGVSEASLSHIVNKKRKANVKTIENIAKAIGLELCVIAPEDMADTEKAIPIEWVENWKRGKTSIEQVVADKIIVDFKWERTEREMNRWTAGEEHPATK